MIHLLKKNRVVFNLCKKVINAVKKAIYKLVFLHMPVRADLIIFSSYTGKNYSCNPKAIFEEMIKDKRFNEYTFVWAFKDIKNKKVNGAIVVKYGGLKYLYYLSRAKFWIFNAKMPTYYVKKREQIYLQTWHGTPLKKLARDIDIGENSKFYRSGMTKDEMVNTYKRDSFRYNYLISANKFSTKAFANAFEVEERIIIETGYPRNDILTKATEEYIDGLKKQFGIPKGKKVILYAPTWRDNYFDTKGYLFNLKADFNKWHNILREDYFVIYRPHYLIYNTSNLSVSRNFVYDASDYSEINDLYLVSDILVTDYSSVFFDYAILRRPILFYMYDLEEYRDNLRGFYLDIYKDLPGPIIKSESELLESILNINVIIEEFKNRNSKFYSRFCSLNDGNSTKRVIDILFN